MEDIQEYTYNDLRISPVWKRLDPAGKKEIVEFWVGCRALNHKAAWERVDEALFTFRDSGGTLVGVSSAFLSELPAVGGHYYHLRLFVLPQWRRKSGLLVTFVRLARVFLSGVAETVPPAKGLVMVTSNDKFWRPGARRFIERHGWRYVAKRPSGAEAWCQDFGDPPVTGVVASNPD